MASGILDELVRRVSAFPPGWRALEVGTRRWGDKPTHHAGWLSGWSDWVKADVVADAHCLTETFDIRSFDLFWASSVFEHLEKPWVASEEIRDILKPGGWFFVQTHQTFPIHGPSDYFRFTDKGLESLFDWGKNLMTAYDFPCTIDHELCKSSPYGSGPAYLNVSIIGMKP